MSVSPISTSVTSRPRERSDAAVSAPMKLAADDDRGTGLVGSGGDGLGVGERPVGVDADEVGAGDRQHARAGTGGEHERAVRDALAARELDLVLRGVDRLTVVPSRSSTTSSS